MTPTAEVLLLAFGWSAGVGLVGLVAVGLWRRRSVRGALLVVPVVAVLSLVAGIWGAARAMFISEHDLSVVLPVSVVAALVALAVAVTLGRVVMTDVEAVRVRARGLGSTDDASSAADDAAPAADGPTPRLSELAELDAELVRARTMLVDARRRERAMEESRRELIAWVSHDLRTPLAGMRAMAEALEDGVAPDPARYHRQIRVEVDRLSRLVDDLFELSRIRSGGLALALEHVDLRDLVADVVSGSAATARARGVRLDADAEAAGLVGDGRGLGRVLSNLVVNAIRHTPSDGTVQVRARREGGEAVLEVSDACGGIPEADLPRVFEPGWRGTPSRTAGEDGGGGLGLAIAAGIVQAHRGRIDVRNAGSGCRFEVRLPLGAPAA